MKMSDEGKYLYCIIEDASHRTFGHIGIGERGNEVHTLCYRDLACIISSTLMTKYLINRKNLIAHEKVIEKVMKDYTVLPIRFGTIATSNDEVRSLLMKNYHEFKKLLRSMDNKAEMGLKAFWLNMDVIFKEIAASDREVRALKGKIQNKHKDFSLDERVTLGEKVKNALEKKREAKADEILRPLRTKCIDFCLNDPAGDNVVLNCAFLIDRMQEREFDEIVENLTKEYKNRLKFKYIGPSPPFNFVNLVIRWGGEK
jgi:hypothetical protein